DNHARLAVDVSPLQDRARRRAEEIHHAIANFLRADVGIAYRGERASYVRPTDDGWVEERKKRLDVTGRGRRDERVDDPSLFIRIDLEPLIAGLLGNATPRPAGQLTARCRRSVDHRRDLLKRKIEHVVKDKHHPLSR